MRVFAGTPGTATGLFLRIAQCIFAAGSIASMASTHSFFNFTAFWFLHLGWVISSKRLAFWVGYLDILDLPPSVNINHGLVHCAYSAVQELKCLLGFVLYQKEIYLSLLLCKLSSDSSMAEFAVSKVVLSGALSMSYLIAAMGLQVIWSFGLALIDAYAIVQKKVLHSPVLISLFVVGDWVTATLSLAAASASAGITTLYFYDLGHCSVDNECQKYQASVGLAICCCFTIATSSLIMLWLLASG
ncbi:hypothetical protein CUMW_142930 [Citrus unshiu]|nr:hypothetical protein CUMW_142930 [Citrus unshiu]